jgi:hypothetical protein
LFWFARKISIIPKMESSVWWRKKIASKLIIIFESNSYIEKSRNCRTKDEARRNNYTIEEHDWKIVINAGKIENLVWKPLSIDEISANTQWVNNKWTEIIIEKGSKAWVIAKEWTSIDCSRAFNLWKHVLKLQM